MKIKSGFILEQVGDSWLAVAVGDLANTFHALIKLNSTGAFLWNKISENNLTEGELVDCLLAEYEVERDIAERDIKNFVATLRTGGLLDD